MWLFGRQVKVPCEPDLAYGYKLHAHSVCDTKRLCSMLFVVLQDIREMGFNLYLLLIENALWLGGAVVMEALDLHMEIACSVLAAALLSATSGKSFIHTASNQAVKFDSGE